MAETVVPIYSETQQEVYSLAQTVADNLEANLVKFSDYKSLYDDAYIKAYRQKRTDAMALDDVDQRDDNFQTLRIGLKKIVKNCTDNFQLLKGYINSAFEKDLQEIKYESAGGKYYLRATEENWENAAGLNNDMVKFIVDNAGVLGGGGSMPLAFATKVNADANEFTAQYGLFKAARQTSAARATKINANNDLDEQTRFICDEGRMRVFIKDADKAKEFTRSDLMFIISPPGSASFKVTTKNVLTNEVIANADITINLPKTPTHPHFNTFKYFSKKIYEFTCIY